MCAQVAPGHQHYFHHTALRQFPHLRNDDPSIAHAQGDGNRIVIRALSSATEPCAHASLQLTLNNNLSDDRCLLSVDGVTYDMSATDLQSHAHTVWKLTAANRGTSTAVLQLPSDFKQQIIIEWAHAACPLLVDGARYQRGDALPSLVVYSVDAAVQVINVQATLVGVYMTRTTRVTNLIQCAFAKHPDHVNRSASLVLANVDAVHLLVECHVTLAHERVMISDDVVAIHDSKMNNLYCNFQFAGHDMEALLLGLEVYGSCKIHCRGGDLKVEKVYDAHLNRGNMANTERGEEAARPGSFEINLDHVIAEIEDIFIHLPFIVDACDKTYLELDSITTDRQLRVVHRQPLPEQNYATETETVLLVSVAADIIHVETVSAHVKAEALSSKHGVTISAGTGGRPACAHPRATFGWVQAENIDVTVAADPCIYSFTSALSSVYAGFVGWSRAQKISAVMEVPKNKKITVDGCPTSATIHELPRGTSKQVTMSTGPFAVATRDPEQEHDRLEF